MAPFLRPSMEYRCVTRLILLINNATVTRSLNLINCGYIALYPRIVDRANGKLFDKRALFRANLVSSYIAVGLS